jgi:hypothetical protein
VNKADRIWEMLQEGLEPTVIADRVGCLPQYVYVVRQRRNSPGGLTPSERAWREANREDYLKHVRAARKRWYWERDGKRKTAAWAEANRARRNARERAWRQANPDKMLERNARRRAARHGWPTDDGAR